MRKKKQKNQGRVRNATRNVVDGIEFKSKLESYFYKTARDAGFELEYESRKIQLIEPFRSHEDKAIRACTYKPDFFIYSKLNYVIETKGYFTDVAKLKWKMFLRWMYDNNYMIEDKRYEPILLMSIKQIDEFINKIKLNEKD